MKLCFFFFLQGNSMFKWASLVAQTVKSLPTVWETRVQSLGWEDPLEKEMATHSNILAWKIPWTEEPGGLQSMGLQRVGHDWATSLSVGYKNENQRGNKGLKIFLNLKSDNSKNISRNFSGAVEGSVGCSLWQFSFGWFLVPAYTSQGLPLPV